jgi:hypothetical protein
MNSTSDPDAPLTGGWITGSYEKYTSIQVERLVGAEFAASTGGAYAEQNGVCCCVDDGPNIYVGVSRDECATMTANWTPDDGGTSDLGHTRHYIAADEIVWYDGVNAHYAEGNCYPSTDLSSVGYSLGPIGGPHDDDIYGNNGGCYVAP